MPTGPVRTLFLAGLMTMSACAHTRTNTIEYVDDGDSVGTQIDLCPDRYGDRQGPFIGCPADVLAVAGDGIIRMAHPISLAYPNEPLDTELTSIGRDTLVYAWSVRPARRVMVLEVMFSTDDEYWAASRLAAGIKATLAYEYAEQRYWRVFTVKCLPDEECGSAPFVRATY